MSRKKLQAHLKHHVVYQAPQGAMDSHWIHDAWKKKGAEAVVSGDYDIGYWCEDLGMLPIWVPDKKFKLPSEQLAKFINREIIRMSEQREKERENEAS